MFVKQSKLQRFCYTEWHKKCHSFISRPNLCQANIFNMIITTKFISYEGNATQLKVIQYYKEIKPARAKSQCIEF